MMKYESISLVDSWRVKFEIWLASKKEGEKKIVF